MVNVMDEIKILTKLGLSEKQAIVYSALLELGESPMTDIAKRSKLKRPTVYLVIEELEILGIVSMVLKGKKKIYSAAHPNRIGELLRFRERQFNEILPSLVAKYGSLSGKPKVQMFEGVIAVRDAYRDMFQSISEKKEEILWFGDISAIQERFPEIIKEYKVLLNNKPNIKIRELIYGGDKANKFVEEMKKNIKKENYKIKFLNQNDIHFGLTDQCIIGDKVISFSLSKEIFMLVVDSQELSKTQKGVFEILWEKSI